MENNVLSNPSGWEIIIKLFIWSVVWLIFSWVVFVMFIWLGSTIDESIKNAANHFTFSPLVWLSFMAIWLITSIVWSLVISWIYNVLWNQDYYDMKLMSSWIWAANLLIFIPFLFLYFYVWSILSNIDQLFLVYWFHLFFWIFISFIIMDLVKNPNYSPVYVIWNSFWFIITLLVFFIIYSIYSSQVWESTKNILFFPPILAFSLIPFIASIWEKLYYKFYEMWNDFLYIPSAIEVMVDEEESDEINVNTK